MKKAEEKEKKKAKTKKTAKNVLKENENKNK